MDRSAAVYVADAGNHRVRNVTADGEISTVVGTGTAGFGGADVPAASAQLNKPFGLAADCVDTLYIADRGRGRRRLVRRHSLAGRPCRPRCRRRRRSRAGRRRHHGAAPGRRGRPGRPSRAGGCAPPSTTSPPSTSRPTNSSAKSMSWSPASTRAEHRPTRQPPSPAPPACAPSTTPPPAPAPWPAPATFCPRRIGAPAS